MATDVQAADGTDERDGHDEAPERARHRRVVVFQPMPESEPEAWAWT